MDRKYRIDTEENKQFLKEMREQLLVFGRRFPSPGGSSWYLGDDGTPWTELNRETWITSRMAHVYSIGSMLECEGNDKGSDICLKKDCAEREAGILQENRAGTGDNALRKEHDSLSDKTPGEDSAGVSNTVSREICARLADDALRGLRGELDDVKNGGWYAGLTQDGQIVPNKQCYAHAFVILAACSGLLAGRNGAVELLEDALRVFDQFFWNEKEGLCCDTWDTDFRVLDDYRGLNANMHTVEAFLAVADAAGKEEYRVRAGRIIDQVIGWARENSWRIPEHFTKDWKADLECNKEIPDDRFKPYGATPGHGIEWARLITQWALSMYGKNDMEKVSAEAKAEVDTEEYSTEAKTEAETEECGAGAKRICGKAAQYIEAAEQLYNRAVSDAWNTDGAPGIVYTTDWDGKPVIHDRMHWTLAEAVNTSSVLYRVTGKEKYAGDYAEFMKYLDEKVLDHVNGSWYHQLDQNNHLLNTVWPGKSDLYHAFQATLIPYHEVDVSIAAAVKEALSFKLERNR